MADENINIVVTATDKASQVLAGVGKTIGMLSGAITYVTKKYIEYGDQVKQLSTFTGMSNKETSKLIQLADDSFVSYDQLRTAARAMAMDNASLAKSGKDVSGAMNLSIESLAKLSDQYKNLKSDTERSAFLLDKFGRSGIELAKIMELGGDKIKEMSANIEEGLIIDDAKAERIKKTKQELDSFNDSLDAMRYETADKLLGIFSAMPKPIQDTTLALGQFLSPTNINTLVQFGILLKGVSFTGMIGGITSAAGALAGFATAAWAAIAPLLVAAAPIIALTAALAGLFLVIQKYGADALNTMRMLWALLAKPFMSNESWLNMVQQQGLVQQKAIGGPVSGGQPYIVGERGPELFIPRHNGHIIPNSRLPGGNTYVINYTPGIGIADRRTVIRDLRGLIGQVERGR